MTRARDVADVQENLGGAVPPFAAGKNKIINGDFNINQRAFSSTTSTGSYLFDRFAWYGATSGGSSTASLQTFTLGAAPVAGYEGKNFFQIVTGTSSATNDYILFSQPIESVRTFAGQTITISFWAKAGSGTPKVALELTQNFGSGGSPSSNVTTYVGQSTLSTSWARYSLTIAVPSISGKTIGTTTDGSLGLNFWLTAGSDFNSRTGSLGNQNSTTFQFWGVQLEAGSVATPFTTATGTIQGELAACQRYYYRFSSQNFYTYFGSGFHISSTDARFGIQMPVTMRTAPSFSVTGATNLQSYAATGAALTALTLDQSGVDYVGLSGSSSSLGAGQGCILLGNGSTVPFLQFSAEL